MEEMKVKNLKKLTLKELNSKKVKDFEIKKSAVAGTTTECKKTIF